MTPTDNNLIDLTTLTDAALDAILDAAAAGTPSDFVVEHLDAADRRSIAVAYGWEITPFVLGWIAD